MPHLLNTDKFISSSSLRSVGRQRKSIKETKKQQNKNYCYTINQIYGKINVILNIYYHKYKINFIDYFLDLLISSFYQNYSTLIGRKCNPARYSKSWYLRDLKILVPRDSNNCGIRQDTAGCLKK